MLKVLASIAAGLLLSTAVSMDANAKSRAISTDSSVPQTELVIPDNAVAHLVFISAAGTGQTYTGGGTLTDFLSINTGTSFSPVPGTPIFTNTSAPGATADPVGSPVDLVLTVKDNSGATTTYALDSFFPDNSALTDNPILGASGQPEESGQIYIDQVVNTNNFGVPNPSNLAGLLAAPGVFDVQFLGWQDNNPPASAFANGDPDPWTYNNMVVAVYFTPVGSTGGGGGALPEPAVWSMMLLGLFGLGAAARRANRFAASSAA